MHKVNSSGATAQNEFTNGNPSTGIARTRLEANWLNSVQRELVQLPTQSGKVLSTSDDTQIIQSITLHVATAAALRACPVPTVPNTQTVLCITRGGTAEGDGLGGIYRWVYNSTLTDDGITVLRPSTNPASGRWKLSNLGYGDKPNFGDYSARLATTSYVRDNALPLQADLGSGVDLNTIQTTGIYVQASHAQAAAGTNYPTPLAGKLEVVQSGAHTFQTYHLTDSDGFYYRYRYTTTWLSWRKVVNSAELQNGAPPGTVILYAGSAVPSGPWLKAGGGLISRTTYSTLFGRIGTTYGAGDGSTTFALPNVRAEFPRFWDDGRGVDSGRTLGSAQSFAIQDHYHLQGSESTYNDYGGGSYVGARNWTSGALNNYRNQYTSGVQNAQVATETRPRNIAFLGLIKYE